MLEYDVICISCKMNHYLSNRRRGCGRGWNETFWGKFWESTDFRSCATNRVFRSCLQVVVFRSRVQDNSCERRRTPSSISASEA